MVHSSKIQVFTILFILVASVAFSQSTKQKQLQQRWNELQKEIKKINSLLFNERSQEKSVLLAVEDLNYKISVRQNIINVINQQANLLTNEINKNQEQITQKRARLKVLKDQYAAMIVKSYKSKSENSRIMFLLSSADFHQAYKRLQYIKQYADYQKKQADEIKKQTLALQELNKELSKQKEEKDALVQQNRKTKNALQAEQKKQRDLIASIKRNMSTYAVQIKKKQQEADKIDREIQRIIREAMAASNKKAGKSDKAKTFTMTPEEKSLAANFASNKGKLPWPVQEGIVKMRYGLQPSLIDRTVKINNPGVRIATQKGSQVRAVFDGNVHSIIKSRNGKLTVLIQHGNYFTVYKNLSKLSVSKGESVSTKQEIGEVLTNKSSGESLLNFSIFKNGKTENPANWCYKMR